MAKLGEICAFQSGGTPSKNKPEYFGGEIPWISTTALNGGKINEADAVAWITPKAIRESAAKIVPANSIMVGTRVGIGKVAINTVEMSTSQDVISLIGIDEDKWYKPYLCKLLLSKKDYFNSQARGATIKGIKIDVVANIDVPEIDYATQRKIAETLSKVDELIAFRDQQLTKLDELVKARFVEMFGDPYVNNKHYPLRKGESFFKLSNGKGVPEDKRLSNGVPAYGGNGISWYTNESLFNYDTIVVGRVGFQSGNVHIAKGPLWITDNAMYMSSCDFSQYNLIFLINLMEHIDFTRFQDAGDLKKITQKPFMQYEYLCPPLSLQSEFAAFVERVDQQKQTVQQSLEKLELMKKALMQEYFG